jgi:hypothetical protein
VEEERECKYVSGGRGIVCSDGEGEEEECVVMVEEKSNSSHK